MASATEARRPGEFMVSEANGHRSREQITIDATAGAMEAGTVLGKLTAGDYVDYDGAADDGSQTAVGVLFAGIEAGGGPAVMIARDAEVVGARLTGIDADGTADLAAAGIIVR
jgi:hypothetical protein